VFQLACAGLFKRDIGRKFGFKCDIGIKLSFKGPKIMRFYFSFVLFLAFTFEIVTSIESSEVSRQEYLELMKRYPNLIQLQGDFSKGEIQIILDPQEMADIEKATGRDVGVMMQDKYWLWINDACLFPGGRKGVYGRILWVKSLESCPGVVVLPVMPDGKIVLNCNFRHATRSWEIELPRGLINFGEEPEAAAKRETIEETGMVVDDLILLGEAATDTGITNTVVPIFVAKVLDKQSPQQEESEAIEEILSLTIQEIKQAFLQGYHECHVRRMQKRIPFRDPFLAYAILMYELKQQNAK
jgi:ADP-ribose pyrophosphatase